MSTTEHSLHGPPGSLLGWLGLGKSRRRHDERAPDSGSANVASLVSESRTRLLDSISSFLQDNDLEITPFNLLAAHGAFSGRNPGLARKLSMWNHADGKITQQWLDEVSADDAPVTEDADLAKMMAKVESSLDSLSANARSARSASSKYGSQLEQHSSELEEERESSRIVANLADLTKVMLEHTRTVQEQMQRSENEAGVLRKSLAKAKRVAETDHLTGLPNRRAFETLLDKHHREAKAAVEPLSVAFCDIDHFKNVNDLHGHDTGDRVIKAVADALSRITDGNCHVARHGGEEFVILFRNKGTSDSFALLDGVREQLAIRKFVNRKTDKPIGHITFSGGIANVFGFSEPRAALAAADEALYQAKIGGRNQILTAKDDGQ